MNNKERALSVLEDLESELCTAIADLGEVKDAVRSGSLIRVHSALHNLRASMDRLQYGDSETWPEIRQVFSPWDMGE